MVQLKENAVRSGAGELFVSSLRPTVYRPSRPVVARVSNGEKREPEAGRARPDADSRIASRPDVMRPLRRI